MKKITALLLALLLALTALTGCTGGETTTTEASTTEEETEVEETKYVPNAHQAVIQNPVKERPVYTLKEGATIEEMRQTALRAFKDNLTYAWTPVTTFTYEKEGSVAREYVFSPNIAYAGVPYSQGCNSMLAILDYYDFDNGVVYGCDFSDTNKWYGASCSASASWGICAVCTSVPSAYSTHNFVMVNGWLPLGEVTYDANLKSFKDYTTKQIVIDNGEQKVLEAYALMDVADMVISSGSDETDVHGMMISAKPNVVRNEDNTINARESTVLICDQRASETAVVINGQQLSMRGRVDAEVTFEELYKKFYLALTTKEFLGQKPYEVPYVKLDREVADLATMAKAKVLSNHRLVSLKLNVTNEKDKVVYKVIDTLESQTTDDAVVGGYAVTTVVKPTLIKKNLEGGQTYKAVMTAIDATGVEYTLASVEFTVEK